MTNQSRDTFPSVWLSRCKSEEERADLKSYLLNCRRLFTELEYLLDKEEKSIARGETDYSNANWAYQMAHYNGMREMLSRIKQLIP